MFAFKNRSIRPLQFTNNAYRSYVITFCNGYYGPCAIFYSLPLVFYAPHLCFKKHSVLHMCLSCRMYIRCYTLHHNIYSQHLIQFKF